MVIRLEAVADTEALANGWTPVIYAVRYGHVDCMKVLLAQGANPKVRSKSGSTLLHIASINGKAKCLEALLEADESVDFE